MFLTEVCIKWLPRPVTQKTTLFNWNGYSRKWSCSLLSQHLSGVTDKNHKKYASIADFQTESNPELLNTK